MAKVDTERADGSGDPFQNGETVEPIADEYGRQVVVVSGGITVTGGATEAKQDEQTAELQSIAASAGDIVSNTDTANTLLQDIENAITTAEGRYTSLGGAVSATIKNSTGKLLSVWAGNCSTTTKIFLWIGDSSTPGSSPIFPPVPLPANVDALVGFGIDMFTSDGHAFSTALTFGFSTSRTTYTAHGTPADCHITVLYT